MSKFLHHFTISSLLPFFFIIYTTTQANPNCPTVSCNDLTISYPFWIKDNQTTSQFCGYEGFGVSCSNNGDQKTPTITIGNNSFYVQNITYETHSMLLMDDEAYNMPKDCPRVRHNISWQSLPSNLVGYDNLNLCFHFNCTDIPNFATRIPCLDYGERKSCVHIMNPEAEDFEWDLYSCEEEVVKTILKGNESEGFGRALRKGFELSWKSMEDCVKCEESNGRCGRYNNKKELICFCSDGRTTSDHCNKGIRGHTINWRLQLVAGIGSSLLLFVLICTICCKTNCSWVKCVATLKRKTDDDVCVEDFIKQYGYLTTKRYNYVEIKKMTNSFEVKLGHGGFGTVFKGRLSDGRLVAVKVLNSFRASAQEFINEVASIGRTSHVNVIALLGFCSEQQKRALIYEFMPNGSLDKFIYSHDPMKASLHLAVLKLYDIALGIARGLDYLHRGCNTRILHLDIKAHNILLDEDFCPKLADFGLAKLYSRKDSIVSLLETRGTIGYIAPEVFNRNIGGVSHKSDVYSFGMLILEMVGMRKTVNAHVHSSETSDIYFPSWIYNFLEKNDHNLDDMLTIEENDYVRKMTIVGLWCILMDPMERPSIDQVIEMLEGNMEGLEVPPKPTSSSPLQSLYTKISSSQSESEISAVKS